MTRSENATLDADELRLLRSGLVMTPSELLALSQAELDSLKLIQEVHSEVVERLTAPADTKIRDDPVNRIVEKITTFICQVLHRVPQHHACRCEHRVSRRLPSRRTVSH